MGPSRLFLRPLLLAAAAHAEVIETDVLVFGATAGGVRAHKGELAVRRTPEIPEAGEDEIVLPIPPAKKGDFGMGQPLARRRAIFLPEKNFALRPARARALTLLIQ